MKFVIDCGKLWFLKISTLFSFKWKRPFQMVSINNYHLTANEEFFISLTSKLITYFIDSCTLEMKSQLFIYQVGVNIYFGPLKLRCTQYGFCGTRWPWTTFLVGFIFFFLSWGCLRVAGRGPGPLSYKGIPSLQSSLGCFSVQHFHWWVWGLLLVINARDTLCVWFFSIWLFQLPTTYQVIGISKCTPGAISMLTNFVKLSCESTFRVNIYNTYRGAIIKGGED